MAKVNKKNKKQRVTHLYDQYECHFVLVQWCATKLSRCSLQSVMDWVLEKWGFCMMSYWTQILQWMMASLLYSNCWICFAVGSVLHELDVMKELSAMHIQMLQLRCHNLYWRLHCQRIWWVLTFQGYAWHNSFGRFLPVLCASQILLITSDLST